MSTRICVLEASLLFDVDPETTLADLQHYADCWQPDVMALTECTRLHGILNRVDGYKPARLEGGEIAFLIRDEIPIKARATRRTVKAPKGSRDGYLGRVRILLGGEQITLALTHLFAHQWQHMGKTTTDWRVKGNAKTLKTLGRWSRWHGRGRRVFLWMGDLNTNHHDDDGTDPRYPAAHFRRYGLISCWDELEDLGAWTARMRSHGKNLIDYIGRRKNDRRVQLVAAHPLARRSSDHRAVWSVYRIGS